jgi:S1-C subfamily serine protease
MSNKLSRSSILLFSILILLTMTACGLFGVSTGILATPLSPAVTVLPSPTQTRTALQLPQVSVNPSENGAVLAQSGIDLQDRLIEVYQKTNPSVVYIITSTGGGSGFVIDQEGHIVTNHHVVTGSRSFEVVFANGDRSRARQVGTDEDSDLAVIRVDALPEGVQPLPLAEPGNLVVGQFVVAIGNPFGQQGSMSLGIVSGLGRSQSSQRDIGMGSTYSLPQVIQTDAPINPGNSGGPLLNLDGEVVGINSAIATFTGTNSGVGFSIPVAAVQRITPRLIEAGRYEYPYIGATFASELSLEAIDAYNLPQFLGAYVLGVTEGSPAQQAGLVPADTATGRGGDLIIDIDGQQIRNFSDLNSYLVFQASVGQTIEITVLRGNERVTLPLVLGERPFP